MLQNRLDPLEHGDLSALICVDDPVLQPALIDQLSQLRFGIHTAVNQHEVSLRLRSRTYEVVVISAEFEGGVAAANGVIQELSSLSGDQRRGMCAVLIGPDLETESEIEAFIYSVDLTVASKDLPDFKRIVGRGIAAHESFYSTFKAMIKMVKGG